MSQNYSKYETLAIAYLTGQASPEEVNEYRRLYSVDAGFREIVDDVEGWLAPLKGAVPDQMPPAGLLDDIMGQIAQSEKVTPHAQTDGLQASAATVAQTSTNDNTARKWRSVALVSSLVAILAVGSHFIPLKSHPGLTEASSSPLLALLSDASQPELMAIVYNPKTGKVVASLSNISLPTDGDFELWLIREGASAPVSLGILNPIDEGGRIELVAPVSLHTGTDTLAISLEKKGGSATEGPAGPVLYTGAVSAL